MSEIKNGTYAITEQGDLGLGLTPILEETLEENSDTDKKENEVDMI